jgi:FkbM family methyltransferase
VNAPLEFDLRWPSDIKAIREVVEKRAYAGHGFTPSPGERWLDLGANIGAFAVWAGAHGADVVAFEPDPDLAAAAAHNVALNGLDEHVTVVPAGVWAAPPGPAVLHRNTARGNVWRNSLHKSWRGGEDVPVDMLDITGLWTPDANVKMDIEGAEMDILEALAHRPVRRLVFEWSFDIDGDLDRFRAVMTTLADTYEHVRGGNNAQVRVSDRWTALGANNAAMIYCW